MRCNECIINQVTMVNDIAHMTPQKKKNIQTLTHHQEEQNQALNSLQVWMEPELLPRDCWVSH